MSNKELILLGTTRWIQSPMLPEVKKVLSDINTSESYINRGSGEATSKLKDLIKRHRNWISPIIDVSDFPYAYITNGVTDAINLWKLIDKRPWQIRSGDYSWPAMIDPSNPPVDDDNAVLYVSNPSAINGNVIDLDNITAPVILDCTYIGAINDHHTITVPPNTEQVMFGFSKGWGVIGQRLGIVYTKHKHPILHPLQMVECWNYLSVDIMDQIIKSFPINYPHYNYSNIQNTLCDKLDLKASDTYFIGLTDDAKVKHMRRAGKEARLCLTPLIQRDI
jgi:hypothetical protein